MGDCNLSQHSANSDVLKFRIILHLDVQGGQAQIVHFLFLLSCCNLKEDHLFDVFPHPKAVKPQTASGKGEKNETGSENRSQSQFRSEAMLFDDAIALHVRASVAYRMLLGWSPYEP